jgi:hypothetical protein
VFVCPVVATMAGHERLCSLACRIAIHVTLCHDHHVAEQVTPEQRKAEAVVRLIEPGRRRLNLLAELDRLDVEIRPLVLAAIAAKVPYRRITELTGVSPVTLTRWKQQVASD